MVELDRAQHTHAVCCPPVRNIDAGRQAENDERMHRMPEEERPELLVGPACTVRGADGEAEDALSEERNRDGCPSVAASRLSTTTTSFRGDFMRTKALMTGTAFLPGRNVNRRRAIAAGIAWDGGEGCADRRRGPEHERCRDGRQNRQLAEREDGHRDSAHRRRRVLLLRPSDRQPLRLRVSPRRVMNPMLDGRPPLR